VVKRVLKSRCARMLYVYVSYGVRAFDNNRNCSGKGVEGGWRGLEVR
jgi:hypothetical protein